MESTQHNFQEQLESISEKLLRMGGIVEEAIGKSIRALVDRDSDLASEVIAFDSEIERYAQSPPYRAQVEALCCLRGVKVLTAVTLLCEIDDVRRFRSPRALMAYFGVVPSERSSGERERRGPITKAGNNHARRVLIEAAWNNRSRSGADLILKRRRQGQPAEVVAIAVKAQHRLSRKMWRLSQRKHQHVAITAVARELCGFIWAILKAVPQD